MATIAVAVDNIAVAVVDNTLDFDLVFVGSSNLDLVLDSSGNSNWDKLVDRKLAMGKSCILSKLCRILALHHLVGHKHGHEAVGIANEKL